MKADGKGVPDLPLRLGLCVKRGDQAFRARMLLDAFEQAYRRPVEQPLLREVVGAIERALEAEHPQTGRTSSVVLPPDGVPLIPPVEPKFDSPAEAAS